MIKFVVVFLISLKIGVGALPCAQQVKQYGIVCVCNSTYCDTIEPLGTIREKHAILYETSKSGKRLSRRVVKAEASSNGKVKVFVNSSQHFQTVIGFGAAFTDAVGINLKSLSVPLQNQIINQYFSSDGLGYTIGRVPMASTDFSTREYSYDDVDLDFGLTNFNLTIEDIEYKIPFIKKAQIASKNRLKLFASPWSPPAWMKTSGKMIGGGRLIGDENGKFFVTWANYFVRFFEEYHKNDVDFWSLTVQNEPISGLDPFWKWQTCYFSSTMERNFIKKLLGPALAANNVTKHLKIMINDDQRINLPHWADTILDDPMAASYVNGIGIHWYEDFFDSAEVLTTTHQRHPNHFLLGTEACAGYFPATGPELGKWSRAEQYANDLMQDMNNFVAGWVDWNFVLDLQGGPNLAQNYVDSPIIVNSTAGEYYKQPMWHTMAHFSKFVKPGSIRIETKIVEKSVDIEGITFLNEDGTKTTILLNKNSILSFHISLADVSAPNQFYELTMEPNSLITIVFN